jgi:hypothetical protein
MNRRLLIGTGVAVLVAALMACTSVEPVPAPQKYIAAKQPRTVWLTRTNHAVQRVDGPRMIGDTVVGSVSGEYTEVPLDSVTRVVAVQPAKGKTIAAAALGGAVVAGALVVIFSHSGSSSNGTVDTIADSMTL